MENTTRDLLEIALNNLNKSYNSRISFEFKIVTRDPKEIEALVTARYGHHEMVIVKETYTKNNLYDGVDFESIENLLIVQVLKTLLSSGIASLYEKTVDMHKKELFPLNPNSGIYAEFPGFDNQ